MDLKLKDVEETALIPLAIKAEETSRKKPRIVDYKAQEIIETLGVDVSKYNAFFSHEGVVARVIMYERELKSLIKKYPDAVCINLGCGFDEKFSHVDNGKITWYDVDLPDQIALRRKVYKDQKRCVMLNGNALESDWTKNIPKDKMVIVVMEGVLEYFSKEQVTKCLKMLADSFKEGYLLAELIPPFAANNTKINDSVKHTKAKFGWGTKTGKEYTEVEPRMKLISEHSYNEEMKKYSIRGKIMNLVGKNLNNRLALYHWNNK